MALLETREASLVTFAGEITTACVVLRPGALLGQSYHQFPSHLQVSLQSPYLPGYSATISMCSAKFQAVQMSPPD